MVRIVQNETLGLFFYFLFIWYYEVLIIFWQTSHVKASEMEQMIQ